MQLLQFLLENTADLDYRIVTFGAYARSFVEYLPIVLGLEIKTNSSAISIIMNVLPVQVVGFTPSGKVENSSTICIDLTTIFAVSNCGDGQERRLVDRRDLR